MHGFFNQLMNITIEFDGGTPCNIPRLGYGEGYGSYRLNSDEIVRIQHGIPMSNNAAEIATLAVAVQDVRRKYGTTVSLIIKGDSQIALKWARVCSGQERAKINPAHSPAFIEAIRALEFAMKGISSVTTEWQPRAKSVEAFGH